MRNHRTTNTGLHHTFTDALAAQHLPTPRNKPRGPGKTAGCADGSGNAACEAPDNSAIWMAVNAPAVRGRGICNWGCFIRSSSKVGESRWCMELPMLHVARLVVGASATT